MILDALAMQLLRALDAEQAHRAAIAALRLGGPFLRARADDPILATSLWGLDFPNPLGIAAGFDKHAEAPDALLSLGFGSVEIGSVTPLPQPGNPRPRVFRLVEDEAVINRYGFNSDGIEAVARRLIARQRRGIVGVNLGKNKETADAAKDYAKGAAALSRFADYLVVNVSSPNTPGLRALQGRGPLEELIARVQDAMPAPAPPLLVKIAPDMTPEDLSDVAEVALARGLAGVIVSNTTITRPETLRSGARGETGGLSGRPLFELSTAALAAMWHLTRGRITLVGVGGVSSGAEAYAKIRAGASLVQVYTGMIYEGPGLVRRINRELVRRMDAEGVGNIAEVVGTGTV